MNDLWYGTSGPREAEIVIVGEAWGREEENQRLPFVGESGKEFTRILNEAGIDRANCLLTNCFATRPERNDAWTLFQTNQEAKTSVSPPWRGLHPLVSSTSEIRRMWRQVAFAPRKVVVACGNYALWALTAHSSRSTLGLGGGVTVNVPSGISSWRGSMTYSDLDQLKSTPLLPILHPAALLRAWYQRAVTVHDLRERIPLALKNDWRPDPLPVIKAPASFEETRFHLQSWLTKLKFQPMRLVADIETARGLITCIGFSDGPKFALVIPFIQLDAGACFQSFWREEEETELVTLIRKIFLHPNLRLEGQNFIYDTQYIRHFLGVVPRLDFDTMLAHHLLFPGTPKGLDYLSSLYCKYHWYWKDESKEWDTKHQGFSDLLRYNALDVMRTFECATVLRSELEKNGLTEQWKWEKKKADLALRMMIRGIAVDQKRRAAAAFDLLTTQKQIHAQLEEIIPPNVAWETLRSKTKKPWYSSAKQTMFVLYEMLGLPKQNHRKTGNPTVDDEALASLRKKVPEFSKLFSLLSDERSVDVFASTFLAAPLDPDGRMRCSFNPAGTETFRWSSSSNAFGGGGNLQNIPKGTEDA